MKHIVAALAFLILTPNVVAQNPPDVQFPPVAPPKVFAEPLEVEGSIVAYRWPEHLTMGFEGIYTDVLIVRVNKLLKGELHPKYIRVDFWGNVDAKLNLQLPTELFSSNKRWRMLLLPPSAEYPRHEEVCQKLSKETVTIYDDTGKTREVSALRRTSDKPEQFPPVNDLSCFVVRNTQVTPVR